MVAADILDPTHALHKIFVKWLGGKDATKRQARKFLASNAWTQKDHGTA